MNIKGIINIFSSDKYMKIAMLSGFMLVILFTIPSFGQSFGLDAETANALGEATQKNSALAYVLGFVTVASMSLAAYTIKTKDSLKDDIQDLTDAIKEQNKAYLQNSIESDRELKDSFRRMTDSIEAMSKKPCAMDNTVLSDMIKGKFSKG